MKYIWKSIKNCDNYLVNQYGKVFSKKRERMLKIQFDNGYGRVNLRSNNGEVMRFSVHRLVAYAFIGEPTIEKNQINHIDGNKKNNYYKNLEWVSCKENIKHAFLNGLMITSEGKVKNYPIEYV